MAMRSPLRVSGRPANWRGKGAFRILLMFVTAVAIAGFASMFGITRDYGYLHATLLAGAPGGSYHTLATSLAARAARGRGSITVIATAGSVENVHRLAERGRCTTTFALVQDGIAVPPDARLEVLGRLPESESLLLLGRRGRAFPAFSDLQGAAIGIGPDGSGTADLMRELFKDPDLAGLGARLSNHTLAEQAELVAKGQLDLAATVMGEDAAFIRNSIRQYDLDIVAPKEIEGLIKRHSWLGLGRIPAGLYDLLRPVPPVDRSVANVDTLVVTNACSGRSERMALLTLLREELPAFVRRNPPRSIGSVAALPLAPEARQFFVSGEPEVADQYFPWLVDIMSPVYWVYLLMAVTILFNTMRGFSRFRLWRIDSTREKLEARLERLAGAGLSRDHVRAGLAKQGLTDAASRTAAQDILDELTELRARCQRYTGSLVTPMGDEMFYRYQEALIDDLINTLARPFRHLPEETGSPAR